MSPGLLQSPQHHDRGGDRHAIPTTSHAPDRHSADDSALQVGDPRPQSAEARVKQHARLEARTTALRPPSLIFCWSVSIATFAAGDGGRPSRAMDGSVNGQRGPSTHSEMDRVESTRRGIRKSPTISAGERCAEASDNWAERISRLDDKPSGTAQRSRRARVVKTCIVSCITPRHFKRPTVVDFELSCGGRVICRLGKGSQRNGVMHVGSGSIRYLHLKITYGDLANAFYQGRSSAVGVGVLCRDG